MNDTIRLVFCIFLALNTTTAAAQQFEWPEEPENLQVLAEGTKGNQLGAIMRGFVRALDVRCEHCHVGEGNDLTKFDFASDDRAAKRKARVMIEMVRSLNQDHLTKLATVDDSQESVARVTCMTCHHKLNRPVMLGEVLADTIRDEGIDAAVTRYHELRERYYGGFSFDFSAGELARLGERLGKAGDVTSGIRLIELEVELNGESPSVLFTLGGLQASGGLADDAIQSFTRGMALAPDGWKPFFQAELDKLAAQD